MDSRVEEQLRLLARRAGLGQVPTSVLAATLAAAIVASGFATWRWWPREDRAPAVYQAADAESNAAGVRQREATPTAPAVVFVHVVGAVRHPGLYEVPEGSRLADAVDAAGGLMPDAVASSVNLARPVSDGEQIVVPDEDDPLPAVTSGGGAAGGGVTGGGAAAGTAGQPVDINAADAALLDTLPGIGPATAAKIVADREANGPFSSEEDLGRISGIGPKKLEQLKGLILVR